MNAPDTAARLALAAAHERAANAGRARFERMFEANDDPWGFRTRWYEARKRDLMLACLPEARYRHAYEPGCANGELLAALAPRCDRVLGSDGVQTAVDLARRRVKRLRHVEVVQAWMPTGWPAEEAIDLIVLSELAYYLPRDAFGALIVKMRRSLGHANGTLIACHWRHPIEGSTMTGDQVHRLLDERLKLPRLAHHEERDFVIDVWRTDPRSVAEREGLVAG